MKRIKTIYSATIESLDIEEIRYTNDFGSYQRVEAIQVPENCIVNISFKDISMQFENIEFGSNTNSAPNRRFIKVDQNLCKSDIYGTIKNLGERSADMKIYLIISDNVNKNEYRSAAREDKVLTECPLLTEARSKNC
ncbi:MAG: hypothetical protein C0594_08000 [Marinilabiliales bacterium]|nr:MAG: hypothetical protein C0594_08000 [Marinilabiliales bacterium]